MLCLCHIRHTAKLRQQVSEPFDRQFVSGSIGGENAVAILKIGPIVTHLKAKEIGEPSARFFKNYLRSARVPQLGTRARVNVDVAGLIRY